MNITQLSTSRVLITLHHDDMKNFELSFDKIGLSNPHSKKVLSRLTSLAIQSTGLSVKNKSIMLEALQNDDGCLILVSINDKNHARKKYRIKRITEYPCYRFDSCEQMLNVVKRLYQTDTLFYNNSLVFYNNNYYLVFDYPLITKKASLILSEFATKVRATKAFVARLYESGKSLSKGNAIIHVGSTL